MTLTSSTPACGFVRLPQDWLHLPISPQAKTLLMAFCGYADEKGESWFSYDQLGQILNRSRSSVCAYVKELREHGLVACTKQTYGNGYNYRLLIRVNGWADLLAHWARMAMQKATRAASPQTTDERAAPDQVDAAGVSAQDSERRVQDAERKDPSGPKTQIHQTQTHRGPPRVVWGNEDERAWRDFRPSDSDPPTSSFGTPSRALLEKTIAASRDLEQQAGLLDADTARVKARSALDAFVSRRRLSADDHTLSEAAMHLAETARTAGAIDAAISALDAAWKPHWRRMSLPRQMMETVTPAIEGALPSRELREKCYRFRGRAGAAGLHLRRLPREGDMRQTGDQRVQSERLHKVRRRSRAAPSCP